MSEANGTLSARLIALLTEEVRLRDLKDQIDAQLMALRGAIQECRNMLAPQKEIAKTEVKEDA